MKIVNIAINPCGIGGTETFSRILNKNFKNSKTYSYHKAKKSIFSTSYKKIQKVPYKNFLRFLTLGLFPKRNVYNYSFKENCIIVINAPCDFDKIPFHYLKDNKIVFLAHNEPNHIWNHKNYFGKNRNKRLKALQYVDKIITLSPNYIDTFSKLFNLPVERFTSVTHTVETIPVANKKSFQNRIITICRIDNKQKRLDRFVEVAKALPDFSFEIYGFGKDENLIKDLIKDHSNISFLGATSDINAVHRKAGIFLMTSDFEGFAISPIEALSQATPVIIAPNSYGMAREVIQDGMNGYVCEEFNIREVIEKINLIEKNYTHFSKNALESFKKYDNNSFKRQWNQIFGEL